MRMERQTSRRTLLRLAAFLGAAVAVLAVAIAVWSSLADAPWEGSSTSVETVTATPPSPAFTEKEVLSLATRMIAQRAAGEVECLSADYRPQNQLWVGTCSITTPGERLGEPRTLTSEEIREHRVPPEPSPTWGPPHVTFMTFTFDDQTGQLGD